MLSTYNTQALTQALTSDPALSSPRIIFPARGLLHKWHKRNRPSGRLDILDCITCWLAGHSSTAFLRQNGEIPSVVLISAILISLLSAIGGCFSIASKREAANHDGISVPESSPSFWHIFKHLHRSGQQQYNSSENCLVDQRGKKWICWICLNEL